MKTLFILISLFFAVSLSARQRDSRVREYLPPARIVWQQESQLIQQTICFFLETDNPIL